MSWNYRIIRKDGLLQIMETYYDENGVPDSFGEAPSPYGENVDEVESCYKLIGEAFNKNIIEVDSNWKVSKEIIKERKMCMNKFFKDICNSTSILLVTVFILLLLDMYLPISIKENWVTTDIFEISALAMLFSVIVGIRLVHYQLKKGDR